VYSSPAVYEQRVFAGSFTGDLYCFDAATGDVCWKYRTNGPISGSPIVINGIVYVSSLKGRTYGLDPKSGKLLWSFRRGAYAAVVSDRRRLYLVGNKRIFALAPRRR
jgi:outer membrane protein assembly factor BamB